MPAIENLRSHGAWGRSVVVVPSLSQPSWATLVSGASPEISGSSLINAPYNRIRTLSVDTLFDVAHANHLPAVSPGKYGGSVFSALTAFPKRLTRPDLRMKMSENLSRRAIYPAPPEGRADFSLLRRV